MQRKPKSYSAALMDQIPIKYLVTQAQGLQQELGGEIHVIFEYLKKNPNSVNDCILLTINELFTDPRSALCPAETACNQLPTLMPSGGLGVCGGGDRYPAPVEEDDASQQHL